MGKKIGILGGTFNPIHIGHLLLGETARCHENLDEVWFMPSGISYLKRNISIPDGSVRLEMVREAVKDNPYFRASDVEVLREGNTYTSDTLVWLTERFPEDSFYFIVGADSLMHMETWHQPEIIFQNCTVLAAIRDDVDFEKLEVQKDYLISKFHAKINLLPYPFMDLSSTEIRRRVREGKSIRYMVNNEVLSFIERNHLYLTD